MRKWTTTDLDTLRLPITHTEAATRLHATRDQVARKRSKMGVIVAVKVSPPVETAAPVLKGKLDLQHPDAPQPKLEFGHLPLTITDAGKWLRYGLVSDTHLCCKEERLSELHNQYDIFERDSLKTVFHAGNIVDGYLPRINRESVFETTADGQADYVIANYPQRKGVTTYFITGDDHESWLMGDGYNFGAYLTYKAKLAGREDLVYIGHVEADVELKTGSVSTILKIQHPGGGSAYARSYTGQKQVEAFEGGEKPSILVQGHYHVSNYMNDRNIHVISMPGFQDQTIFARKKRLRMEVGGATLEFKINPTDGTVTRCRVEFNRYFTRTYYKRYLKSDTKILKGHLVLPT